MNTREQYLTKRVEALEAALRLAYEEMFVAQLIIERVESVANAFAFDLAEDCGDDFYSGPVASAAIRRYAEAQEKARADSDKARGIQQNPDGTIAFIDPEKFSGRKP